MKGFSIFYLGEMKLSEYFKDVQSQKVSAQLKDELFSRIQKEKNTWIEFSIKLPSFVSFFSYRRVAYASLAVLLVVVVFGWLLINKDKEIDFGLFSVQKHIDSNWVLADYVAEIIEFNWEYSLERDGSKVSNLQDLQLIEDWDVVTLAEWTDLVFTLVDGTQAKIVWPAEFSITRWKKWYQISLIDGKFFRIYCPECVSDIEIVTPDMSIHQDKDQALDIHIAKEDNWEMLVKNEWDEVVVTTKKDETKKEVVIASTELVTLASDKESIDILSDSDLMALFLAKNNISATFTLSTEDVKWPTIQTKSQVEENLAMNVQQDEIKWVEEEYERIDQSEDPLLAWILDIMSSDVANVWEIDESISSELWILDDQQKVPTSDQMQSLKSDINSFFLMNLFESIYVQDKPEQSISKLADRMNDIAIVFGYSDRATSDLASIKSLSLILKDRLQQDWYISPSYILQLEKIANWCNELMNPTKESWESLNTDLPIKLRLM